MRSVSNFPSSVRDRGRQRGRLSAEPPPKEPRFQQSGRGDAALGQVNGLFRKFKSSATNLRSSVEAELFGRFFIVAILAKRSAASNGLNPRPTDVRVRRRPRFVGRPLCANGPANREATVSCTRTSPCREYRRLDFLFEGTSSTNLCASSRSISAFAVAYVPPVERRRHGRSHLELLQPDNHRMRSL